MHLNKFLTLWSLVLLVMLKATTLVGILLICQKPRKSQKQTQRRRIGTETRKIHRYNQTIIARSSKAHKNLLSWRDHTYIIFMSFSSCDICVLNFQYGVDSVKAITDTSDRITACKQLYTNA